MHRAWLVGGVPTAGFESGLCSEKAFRKDTINNPNLKVETKISPRQNFVSSSEIRLIKT